MLENRAKVEKEREKDVH